MIKKIVLSLTMVMIHSIICMEFGSLPPLVIEEQVNAYLENICTPREDQATIPGKRRRFEQNNNFLPKQINHQCLYCAFVADGPSHLQVHMRIHTGEKPYKCAELECDYAAVQKSALTEHMRIHTGEKPYKCTVSGCDYAATQKTNLTTHMRRHTGEKPYKCKVVCSQCDYAADSPSHLIIHMRKHTGERPYKCSEPGCDYVAAQSGNLTKHMRTHMRENSLKCPEAGCDYVASRPNHVTTHIRVHTGEKPFKCTYAGCDYAAVGKGRLAEHVRCIHKIEMPPQERSFECPELGCYYAAIEKGVLKKHVHRVHSSTATQSLPAQVPSSDSFANSDGKELVHAECGELLQEDFDFNAQDLIDFIGEPDKQGEIEVPQRVYSCSPSDLVSNWEEPFHCPEYGCNYITTEWDNVMWHIHCTH